MSIKDEISVLQSYSYIASRILKYYPSVGQLNGIVEETQLGDKMAAVKRWLEHPKNTQWLLLFDNYDSPEILGNTNHSTVDIRRFLPEVFHGSVVVTTTSSKVNIGRRIQVGKLEDVHDSLQILFDTSHRGDVWKS